jgi:hypothetical protein
MSEMIERAVAAAQAQGTPSFTCTWEDVVRAVIAAMREPTEAMLGSVSGTYVAIYSDRPGFTTTAKLHLTGGLTTYRAMIDEALK